MPPHPPIDVAADAWSVNRLAARAIALAPLPLEQRRELLHVCGLIGPDGRIAPDDRAIHDVNSRFVDYDDRYGGGRLAANYNAPVDRPEGYSSPDALRNLPPAPKSAPQPKAKRRPGPVALSGCGSVGGYSRHRRAGEKPCEACRVAFADYQRAHRQRHGRTDRPNRRQPVQCGTVGGHSKHRRAKEKPCEACLDAYNTARKAKRAERRGAAA